MIEYLVYIIKHSRALENSMNSGVVVLCSVNEKLAQHGFDIIKIFFIFTNFFHCFFFFLTVVREGCKSLQVYLQVWLYHLFIAKFCFILIDFLLLSTHTFIILKFSWGIDPFNIMKYSSLLLVNHSYLENLNCLIVIFPQHFLMLGFFIYIFLYFFLLFSFHLPVFSFK